MYLKLLDPTWTPKPRKPKRQIEQAVGDDDWDEPKEIGGAKARHGRGRIRQPQLPDVPGSDGGSSGSRRSSGRASSSGSSSSKSSDSDSSSSDNSSSDGSHSSKSSTSGSSGSSSSTADGDGGGVPAPPTPRDGDGGGVPVPEEDVAEANAGRLEARGSKTGKSKVPYGCCWLTPRFHKQTGVTIAWQMSCVCGSHNIISRCSREYSVAKAGSEDMCLRKLKTWILSAHMFPRKDAHRKWFDDAILPMGESDVATMQELDNKGPDAITYVPVAVPPPAAAAEGSGASQPKRRRMTGKSSASSGLPPADSLL